MRIPVCEMPWSITTTTNKVKRPFVFFTFLLCRVFHTVPHVSQIQQNKSRAFSRSLTHHTAWSLDQCQVWYKPTKRKEKNKKKRGCGYHKIRIYTLKKNNLAPGSFSLRTLYFCKKAQKHVETAQKMDSKCGKTSSEFRVKK